MNNLISTELLHKVIALNNKLLAGEVRHPARLALFLEEIATDAWNEAKDLGAASWEDAEDLPASLKF
ncbi:hypothetical protein [Calothrix sp. PCC 7507]|uniref:hypothetical protein n=1 Tax=Calothrix sp. PCC 7507 TaxID=99598 RepID=UPI00029F3282|nr:hypothetical protein [Calothrix sp. PCC 7507]AFY34880.1 hypothetical protein Cal7507_4511 [Calothrix sp. PCC 7507]